VAKSVSALADFTAAERRINRERMTVAEAHSLSPATITQNEHPGLRRARIAARVAAENRGREIVILDLRELTCMFDFFVIVSGASRRQLHAISEEIDRVLQVELGDKRMGIEGYEESRWILLDYGDVVVHMFEPETRAYYAIEELWAQAKRVPLEEGAQST
jgi:ribosome-associated protein